MLILLGSCSKKLEKLYYDPDELATAKIEKLFTEMLNNDRVRPSYWEMRTFAVMHSAIYSQTVGFLNTTGVFQQNLNYTEGKWNDFYRPAGNGSGTLALYREMQKLYEELSGSDRIQATIFLKAAAVVLYDQACQMVDLWGDIPFSEAGSLNLNGEAVMAKFDKGEDIYREAIDVLYELNDYFATVQPDLSTQNLFRTQDILLRGDVTKWRRYCNALRLRLLMRISNVM
ncbi:MAG TPA: SusD/RagB family nutrient-binding outer membrane lipoprotein, partial [Flavihumibacter sp.]